MGGVVIEEFVCLRPKMYSILLRDSNESKLAIFFKKNVVAKLNHNEYKDVLFNIKYLRRSVDRIQ